MPIGQDFDAAIRAEFSRLGKIGGRVRAERLTPERRRAIAAGAALIRWRGRGAGTLPAAPTDDPPTADDDILSRIVRPYLARPQLAPRFATANQRARKAGVPLGTLTELARRWSDLPEPVRAAVERDPERLLVASVPLLVAIMRGYDD